MIHFFSQVVMTISSAQHNNTIELEGVIVALCCAIIAGLYRVRGDTKTSAQDLGMIKQSLADVAARVTRIENKADAEVSAQHAERSRVQRRDTP